MSSPATFKDHLNNEAYKELEKHINSPYRLFIYDDFLEQSIGCRPKEDDWEMFYVIKK